MTRPLQSQEDDSAGGNPRQVDPPASTATEPPTKSTSSSAQSSYPPADMMHSLKISESLSSQSLASQSAARSAPAGPTSSCNGSPFLGTSQSSSGARCGGTTNVALLVGGVACVLTGLAFCILLLIFLRRRAQRRLNRVGDSPQGTSQGPASGATHSEPPPIAVQADDDSDLSTKGGQPSLYTDTVVVRLPGDSSGLLIAWPEASSKKFRGIDPRLRGSQVKATEQSSGAAPEGQQLQDGVLLDPRGSRRGDQEAACLPSPDSTVHSEMNFLSLVDREGEGQKTQPP